MSTDCRYDWSRRLIGAFVALGAFAAATPASAAVEAQHEVIVAFDPAATARDRAEARADVDTVHAENLGVPGLQLLVTDGSAPAAINELRDSDSVRYAVPNIKVEALATPNDPQWSQLWGMPVISAPEAWDITTGSSDVVIGIVDSGIAAHEDLDANRWANSGESGSGKETNGIDDDNNGYVDDWHGWDFHDANNNANDDHGHGSHVSGTSAGAGNNGLGVAGVSWHSKVMALDVFDPSGSGWANDIVEAMAYAGENGARVVNLSLGGDGAYQPYVDVMNAYPGTIFVTAAGNGGDDSVGDNNDAQRRDPCTAPAPNNICVGASTPSDGRASFSNYGATTVDLAAPGTSIRSTVPGGYASWQGTSMATPHVTGAAALLFAARPTAMASQVKQALMDSVDPVPAWQSITVSGGRLNVSAALTELATYDPPGPPANTVLPTVTGTASTASTLTATPGTWTNEPTSYAYQWRACDSAGDNCQDISGATSSTFQPQGTEATKRIRVQVTATGPSGSGTASSAPTAAVIAPPVNSGSPAITGTARLGETLSASAGTWNYVPTSYAYQWQRCASNGTTCSNRTTGTTYSLTSADVGYRIRVRVTATNSSGATTANSVATTAVVPLAPTVVNVPTIATLSGNYQEGSRIVSNGGTWTSTPTSYVRMWQRCDSAGANCVDLTSGATYSYTLTAVDAGSTIRFRETATNAGGSGSAFSIASPLITATPAPPAPPDTTTPPPPTTTVPPVDPSKPTPVLTPASASVAGARASRSIGYVTATIRCTSTTDCSGRVTFTYKKTKLATAAIELDGSSAKRGKVKITRSALKKLPKRGKVAVTATVKLDG